MSRKPAAYTSAVVTRHRAALPSTACTSTTSAIRPASSTTAARAGGVPGVGDAAISAPRTRAATTRARAASRSSTRRAFPERWTAFRRARLTALLTALRAGVKAVRPHGAGQRRGDSGPARGVDAAAAGLARLARRAASSTSICPMAYTTDAAVFAAQIARGARDRRQRIRCGRASAPTACRPIRSSRTRRRRAGWASAASSSFPTTASPRRAARSRLRLAGRTSRLPVLAV